MASENQFLLYSLFTGIFITFVYDLLRIFRRVVPHRLFFVSLEDLAFWIYCAAEVFLLMYRVSNGTLRWFAVMGALTGMFLYIKLVSPLFVKYASLVLSKIAGLMGKILKWLCRPFGLACAKAGRGARRAGGRAGRFLRRGKSSFKNRLTYFIKKLKMGLKAR